MAAHITELFDINFKDFDQASNTSRQTTLGTTVGARTFVQNPVDLQYIIARM